MSRRPALAIAAALAGTAAAVVFIWPSGDTRRSAPCPSHATVPPAAHEALAAYTGRIKHESSRYSTGVLRRESWSDPSTGRRRVVTYDAQGMMLQEDGTTSHGPTEVQAMSIQYRLRMWTSQDVILPVSGSALNQAIDEAQSYRDKLAQGKATIVAREVLAGRETLHLRETVRWPPVLLMNGKLRTDFPGERADTWVDALTYVPVQTRLGSPGHQSQVTEMKWLPRAPANIAKTKLVIPSGFKHRALGPYIRRSGWPPGGTTSRCAQS